MSRKSANYLYFKAPFRTHFSLQEGNVLASGSEYHQFWKRIDDKQLGKKISSNYYVIDYLHNTDMEGSMQFESVSSDSNVLNVFSPHVITIIPGDWIADKIAELTLELNDLLPELKRESLVFKKDSCEITLFKNTVANVDLTFELNLTNSEITDDFIEAAECWTNQLSTKLIEFFYSDFILPLFQALIDKNTKQPYISPIKNHYGFPDINEGKDKQLLFKRRSKCAIPLWVSRVLVIGNIDDDFDELVRRWIITTKSKDEVIEHLRDKLYDEKSNIYLGWMHSLFTAPIDSPVFKDASQALSLTQYYYAVLDAISMNLSQIIGISHKKKSVKETQRYKELLEEMVFIANLNKTEFTDVLQTMQRNRAYFLNDLMDKWTVNDLFDNVDKKIALCKENIDKIYQKAFNRSQRVAELLLFFISGFAILEFLKGLSEFFWSADNYKEEVWGLYALGRIFDPNRMLWFGIVIFLALFIVYTRITNKER